MKNSDLQDTDQRIAIRQLHKIRGITPIADGQSFGCKHLSDCRSSADRRGNEFYTGQWPYVGTEYGKALVGGVPTGVMFVAMDRGGYDESDLPSFADTQESYRRSAHSPSNPHMGSVSVILKFLLDSDDPEVRSHQYALANTIKCVEGTGSMTTKPSSVMRKNCSGHLRAEIDQLEPHIIVTQGWPERTIKSLYPDLDSVQRRRRAGSFRSHERRHAGASHDSSLAGEGATMEHWRSSEVHGRSHQSDPGVTVQARMNPLFSVPSRYAETSISRVA